MSLTASYNLMQESGGSFKPTEASNPFFPQQTPAEQQQASAVADVQGSRLPLNAEGEKSSYTPPETILVQTDAEQKWKLNGASHMCDKQPESQQNLSVHDTQSHAERLSQKLDLTQGFHRQTVSSEPRESHPGEEHPQSLKGHSIKGILKKPTATIDGSGGFNTAWTTTSAVMDGDSLLAGSRTETSAFQGTGTDSDSSGVYIVCICITYSYMCVA